LLERGFSQDLPVDLVGLVRTDRTDRCVRGASVSDKQVAHDDRSDRDLRRFACL
jgi:hypothetical protein